MKVLTFHRLCLIAALVLGLVCTWANAVPKVTSGDLFGGANCGCEWDTNWDCSAANCGSSIQQCHNDPPGAWDCRDNGRTCLGGGQCDNFEAQTCQ